MDISTAWPKSDIHTWIYPWIYPWQAWDVPHTDPIYPGHGNRRNSRTFGCMVRVGFQSGQTSLLQWSDKKIKIVTIRHVSWAQVMSKLLLRLPPVSGRAYSTSPNAQFSWMWRRGPLRGGEERKEKGIWM